jgi:hypothetical protein
MCVARSAEDVRLEFKRAVSYTGGSAALVEGLADGRDDDLGRQCVGASPLQIS